MLTKNTEAQIKIRALSSDGNGIGTLDGMTVFVPFSAVGDELEIRVVSVKKTYAYGVIKRVITPSPDRVPADCPVYTKCGGCCFRHISDSAELITKHTVVTDAIRRIGHLDCTVLPVISAGNTERYRNKVQFPVYSDGESIRCGLYAQRSHRVVPYSDCKLQDELLNTIANVACTLLTLYKITAYDEQTGKGLVRHLYLRCSDDLSEIMLVFVVNGSSLPHSSEIIERLTALFPQIVSVSLNINRAETNVILGEKTLTLYGKGYITDALCGVKLEISPNSFYQVNHAAADALYGVATRLAGLDGTQCLLDLYCGTGSIGLSLANMAKNVVGIDIEPSSIKNARNNASINNIKNAEFYCGDAGEVTRRLTDEGRRFDIIITDPPRKGCDEQTLSLIASLEPHKIIMISCNPATLARDLARLKELGYTTDKVQPVNLFPNTAHVETVALMTKKAASAE